ncbi:DUF3267 domain-containing protein [Metabacillus litoralis]|uniref:DUF3267 domain-containing protein n=2 Tax=Metabacillus litoralis TaxID=152268 RepID=A0A5C6VW04_9BACI|nr:DUF3267 domain-containing protein [Metabacillus litoralis]
MVVLNMSLDGETMNCWKTINLSKDVGLHRISFISMLTMICVFILTYLPINLFFSKVHLKDGHFLMFVLLMVSMIPIHKILHALPLLLCGCRVEMKIKFYYMFPSFQLKACNGIKKHNMLISLLTPFIVFTTVFLYGSILFPAYMHYFSIAMAFHIGLCVPDFIFIKHLLLAPRSCFVEEFDDGFEVLVQK